MDGGFGLIGVFLLGVTIYLIGVVAGIVYRKFKGDKKKGE